LLEHTRTALNGKEDLDMMRLFKRFDRQTRGVINAEDLQKGFYELGGSTSIHGFDLLIQKYAAESGILSYSEFA
jgi:Ca2+-binding EF-hand superfamily protein